VEVPNAAESVGLGNSSHGALSTWGSFGHNPEIDGAELRYDVADQKYNYKIPVTFSGLNNEVDHKLRHGYRDMLHPRVRSEWVWCSSESLPTVRDVGRALRDADSPGGTGKLSPPLAQLSHYPQFIIRFDYIHLHSYLC
jgi:hypothetical protein